MDDAGSDFFISIARYSLPLVSTNGFCLNSYLFLVKVQMAKEMDDAGSDFFISIARYSLPLVSTNGFCLNSYLFLVRVQMAKKMMVQVAFLYQLPDYLLPLVSTKG